MNIGKTNIVMYSKDKANAQIVEIVNRDNSTVEWRVQWYNPDCIPSSGYHTFSKYSKAYRYFDDVCDKLM